MWVYCNVLKEPVHHTSKSILIKPNLHAYSNELGPVSHKREGEYKVAKGVEISKYKFMGLKFKHGVEF